MANVNIDADQYNADWIKTLSWEYPTDVIGFLQFLGGLEQLEHFLTLPVAEQMPDSLRVELALQTGKRVPMKAFDPALHPRDSHGRFAETASGAALTERSAVVTPRGEPGYIERLTQDMNGNTHATVITRADEDRRTPGSIEESFLLSELKPLDLSDAIPIYDEYGHEQSERNLSGVLVVAGGGNPYHETGSVIGVLSESEARGVRRRSKAFAPPFEEGQRVVATSGDIGTLQSYVPMEGTSSIRLDDGRVLADVVRGLQHAGTWDTPAGFEAAGVALGSGRAREVYTGRGTKDDTNRVYAIEYPGYAVEDANTIDGMRGAIKGMVVDNHKLEKDSGLLNAWRGTVIFGEPHEMRAHEAAHKDWNCSITLGTSVILDIKETGSRYWNKKDGEEARLIMIHELAHGLSDVGQNDYVNNVGMEEGVVDGYAKAFVVVEKYGADAEIFPQDGPTPRPPGGEGSGYPAWVQGLTSAHTDLVFGAGTTLIPEDASYTWGDRLEFFRNLLRVPVSQRLDTINATLQGEQLVLTGRGIGTEMGYRLGEERMGKAALQKPSTTEEAIALIFSVENYTEALRVAGVVSDWIEHHPEDAITVGYPAEALAMYISAHEPTEGGEKAFDPNQPRDAEGQWTDIGGGSAFDLPDEQTGAIMDYATTMYRTVNGYLRGGTDGMEQAIFDDEGYHADAEELKRTETIVHDITAQVDAAMKPQPAGTVYRGMILDREPQVGDTFTDKGFVSTTKREDVGARFAAYKLDPEAPQAPRSSVGLVQIAVPEGTRGVDFEDLPSDVEYQEEYEVLLDRGLTYRITGVRANFDGAVDSAGYLVQAEVVQ